MGKIFDLVHILYLVISVVVTAGILVLAKLFLKTQKKKNIFLLITGILPFVLHICILWYEFFATGQEPRISGNILFVVYPCNMIMIVVMVLALLRKKNTRVFQGLCVFCFYVGIVGNTAALIYPIYYIGSGVTFNAIKSSLSHSVLFLCCLWLYVGGYFKIRLTNVIPYAICLASGIIIGLINYFIFKATGHDYKYIMYIGQSAVPGTPFTIWVIAPLSLVVFSLVGFLVEFKYPKSQRSYIHFKVFDKKNDDGSDIIEETNFNNQLNQEAKI